MITLQTHNNDFNIHNVSSVSLIITYLNTNNIKIFLSNDLSESDYLIDIGDEYDPAKNKFDSGSLQNKKGLTSTQMIWSKYGKDILLKLLQESEYQIDRDYINELSNIIYYKLITSLNNNFNDMSLYSIISSINNQSINPRDKLDLFKYAIALFNMCFQLKLKYEIRDYYEFQQDLDKVISLINHNHQNYILIQGQTEEKEIKNLDRCLNRLDPAINYKYILFESSEKEYIIKTRVKNGLVSYEEGKEILMEDLTYVGFNTAIVKNLEAAKALMEYSLLENRKKSRPTETYYQPTYLLGGIFASICLYYWVSK